MPFGYSYGGYPAAGGYYAPPMPDQLAQLRQGAYQQPIPQQNTMMPAQMPAQQTAAQPPQNMIPTAQPQAQASTMSGPVFVNGEAGAKGYLVAAGNTVMLIDADPDANTFWLKSADASGMPSMRTFDYKERMNAARMPVESVSAPTVEYVTRADFDALAARADEMAAELAALKQKKPVKRKGDTDAEGDIE